MVKDIEEPGAMPWLMLYQSWQLIESTAGANGKAAVGGARDLRDGVWSRCWVQLVRLGTSRS